MSALSVQEPGNSRVSVRAAQLELRDVSKEYRVGRSIIEVVKDCSLVIERDKFTVMIGASGVGKSTIVRLIAGFEMPTRGEVLVDGKPVLRPGRDRAVMFQESALFPWMTTEENVLYGPRARGQRPAELKSLGERLLETVGLLGFRKKYPAQLSGGMQRRAELARAMINEPALMILDEPFRGLDAMAKKLMLEYYSSLCESSKRTNFFVTTDVAEAILLADRLLVMTQIPTRVRAVIDVDIPRPRSLASIAASEPANQLKHEILSLLHDETAMSFGAGSKSGASFIAASDRRGLSR